MGSNGARLQELDVTQWLQCLPVAVFVIDAKGTPVYANDAATELLGKGIVDAMPDTLAATYKAYVAGTDREYPAERMPIVRALSGETAMVDDMEIHHPDRTITLEVRATPIRDEQGRVRFAIAAFTDVTDRARAQTELRERSELLDLAQDAIMALDLSHRITYWNKAAEDRYGWSKDEALGTNSHELLRTSPEKLAQIEPALARDGRWEGELIHTTRDGSHIVVASRWAVQRDDTGKPIQILEVNNDITVQKTAEAALRSAKAEAELAKEAAERANVAKSEFLSRMSHELRTPLNAILGFAQLLEMDQLAPDQRDSVEQIVKGGRRLLELINEVLDISRIESGQLRLSLEPVHVIDVISESFDLIRPLADERGILMRSDVSEDVLDQHAWADRQRLGQVLLNLLSNAIKYNVEQGSVTVTCSTDPDDGLRIGVTDTGPGVPAEQLPLLFEPFERLNADQAGVEGTGLGLALSKNLVEAMGGRMAVDSARGRGTTFWVGLRTAQAPSSEEEEQTETRTELGAGRKVVLYIEDNLSNLKLVERVFTRMPAVELISAMTANLGIDLAQQHVPNLILLDLHLPDLRGDEALQRLRRDPRTSDIPIVMLSADASPTEVKRLRAAGADDYLTKPLDIPSFLRVLDTILGSRPS